MILSVWGIPPGSQGRRMFFSKKKHRSSMKPVLYDDEECIRVVKGTSNRIEQLTGVGSLRLAIVLSAMVFMFMYFMFVFGGPGCGVLYSCKHSDDEAFRQAEELNRAIEAQDDLERDMVRYLDDDLPPMQEEQQPFHSSMAPSHEPEKGSSPAPGYETGLANIVFGIAASAKLWEKRQEYVKLWWRPGEMRGFVWLDKAVSSWSKALPPMRISEDTAKFNYTNKKGGRSGIRISRVVSETFRQNLTDVHWFVMGDDDTMFVPENLVRILSKYDHRKFYYIGSHSESHTQNIHFSYNMAYGGGGFAISYPLAKALAKVQDRCIMKYPYLYGSDDRIQACLSELGVPLTKEPGFHQFDIYGDAFGLLAAHPVTPLVSIHHLDLIDPVFPNTTQIEALRHFKSSMRVDPGGVLQQSICYDKYKRWSISVSWGYAVQVYRGILPPRLLELPMRTFLSWYRRMDDIGFPFNTRPFLKSPCEQPTIFYMKEVGYGDEAGETISSYSRDRRQRGGGECKSTLQHSPGSLEEIIVTKEQADDSWHLAPRRQCCRVVKSTKKMIEVSVGNCESGETII
ncbi:glycosyltransferase-like protein [Selaginella moellendorffii]|uniref:Glycosyltransferase-like protein n=2 Tax=Selaginella moellendorffii TaxID=88036 RepID=D8QTD2_SELML|nr:glycosyltransferase-like protein [Selaginella moellendorffii]